MLVIQNDHVIFSKKACPSGIVDATEVCDNPFGKKILACVRYLCSGVGEDSRYGDYIKRIISEIIMAKRTPPVVADGGMQCSS